MRSGLKRGDALRGDLIGMFQRMDRGKMPALIRHHLVSLHYDLAASQYNHSLNILSTGFLGPDIKCVAYRFHDPDYRWAVVDLKITSM